MYLKYHGFILIKCLEDKEREDLEIHGCRRLQQEWERWELEWVGREGWRKKINLL